MRARLLAPLALLVVLLALPANATAITAASDAMAKASAAHPSGLLRRGAS